jgi:hypothetical protein
VHQITDFDLTSAERFGTICTVFPAKRPALFDVRHKLEFLRSIRAANFKNEVDFFLFAGTSVPSILCTSYLIEEYGSFNALLYNATRNCYVCRPLGIFK